MNPDWDTLLDDCRHGDARAREQLFSFLRVRLLSIAQYRLRGVSTEVIEDLVQNTLTLVVERIAAIESNPHLYALQTLRNKIGDFLRSRARRVEQSINVTGGDGDESADLQDVSLADPDSVSFETGVENAEIVAVIRRAVHRLTPICLALFAALLEDRSVSEFWDLAIN